MNDKQKNRLVLIFCLLDVLIISIGHVMNSSAIVMGGIFIFFSLLLISRGAKFLALMLFYLPWSPIMKFNADGPTFYTIAFLLFFCCFLLTKELFERKAVLTLQNLLLVSIITIYTMIVKLVSGYDISLSYVVFLVMLVLIPTYFYLYRSQLSFGECIIFFSAGIMSASFSAKILMSYPHMLRYIEVSSWEAGGLTRLSGFYGDANYYAAHILTAICGLLILVFNKRYYERVLLFFFVITLVYLGFLSVSKMFLLLLGATAGVWLFFVFSQKGRALTKISVLLAFAVALVFISKSPFFKKLIQMYRVRFQVVSDISSFTTGRSDILQDYISYFTHHPIALLFGQGMTQVYTGGIMYAAHNTFVQIIYQLGIAGSIILALWMIQLLSSAGKPKIPHLSGGSRIGIILLAISCFGSWFALDILFADEFFLIPLLFLVGKDYVEKSAEQREL